MDKTETRSMILNYLLYEDKKKRNCIHRRIHLNYNIFFKVFKVFLALWKFLIILFRIPFCCIFLWPHNAIKSNLTKYRWINASAINCSCQKNQSYLKKVVNSFQLLELRIVRNILKADNLLRNLQILISI